MDAENQPTYVLRFCGVSHGNPGPAGAAAVLLDEDRTVLYQFRWGVGDQTDIAAEYHALILGLNQAISKRYMNILAEGDSTRVFNQVKGFEYAHEPTRRLWMKALDLTEKLHSFDIQIIHRVENSLAVAQANEAVDLEEGEVHIEDFGD